MYENELKEDGYLKNFFKSSTRFLKETWEKIGGWLIVISIIGSLCALLIWLICSIDNDAERNQQILVKARQEAVAAAKADPSITYYDEKTGIALTYENSTGTIAVYNHKSAGGRNSTSELKRIGQEYIINNKLLLKDNIKPNNPTETDGCIIYYTQVKQ